VTAKYVAPLSELIVDCPNAVVIGDATVLVSGVTHRSVAVAPGDVFLCVTGQKYNGHRFGAAAVAKGAVALIVEQPISGVNCAQVVVASVRTVMGNIAARFYRRPSDRLRVVGVTGTYGKSTTTHLVASIARSGGVSCGVIGTFGTFVDGREVPNGATTPTTPEAVEIQCTLADMADRGVNTVMLEVTAQALSLARINGTRFAFSMFTNLAENDAPWHLDYFKTMPNYFAAKAQLFVPDLSRLAVVNGDDAYGRRLQQMLKIPVKTFGVSPEADIRMRDLQLLPEAISMNIDGLQVVSQLRGAHNAYNCLAAVAAARECGFDDAAIREGLRSIAPLEGRLEPVAHRAGVSVFIDYAHHPKMFENALQTARALTAGRLIVVFGCPGGTSAATRMRMGQIASSLADLAIITSDDPRGEDPGQIISQITGGIRGSREYLTNVDRAGALIDALSMARPPDVVLITGNRPRTPAERDPDRRIGWHVDTADWVDDRAVIAGALRQQTSA